MHFFDDGGKCLQAFRESEGEIVKLEEIVMKRISVSFFEFHLFCPHISGLHRRLARIDFFIDNIGRKIGEIIDGTGFVISLKGILSFEVESQFFECTDKNLVDLIFLALTQKRSRIFLPAGRSRLEVEDRWRKIGNVDS